MYNFKFGWEAFWFVLTTVVATIAAAFAAQGSVVPTNAGEFLVGIAAALARALPAIILHFTTNGSEQP